MVFVDACQFSLDGQGEWQEDGRVRGTRHMQSESGSALSLTPGAKVVAWADLIRDAVACGASRRGRQVTQAEAVRYVRVLPATVCILRLWKPPFP